MKKIIILFGCMVLPYTSQACLDCSNTGTDATFTGTVTAQGFAGPTISTINSRLNSLEFRAIYRAFDVIVGTLGAVGVDYASNSIREVTNKIYSDKGVSLGSTNTIPLSIFFKAGVYGGNGSTTPAMVRWFTVPNPSGTIYSMEGDSTPITTNYGVQDGFTYDAGSRPFTAPMIRMRDRSEISNFTIIGAQAMANFTAGGAILDYTKSSDTITRDGWFKEYHGCAGSVFQSNCAALRVAESTNTYAYRLRFSTPAYVASPYETIWGTYRSKNSHLYDSVFEGVSAIPISIGSGQGNSVKRNTFILGAGSEADGASYGVITFDGSDEVPAVGSSSTTEVSDNYFMFTSSGGGSPGCIIRSRSFAGGIGNGYLIKNNLVFSPGRTNWAFFRQIGGTVFNIVLKDNDVYNLQTFIQDAGIGTKYTGLGNMFNGIEQ